MSSEAHITISMIIHLIGRGNERVSALHSSPRVIYLDSRGPPRIFGLVASKVASAPVAPDANPTRSSNTNVFLPRSLCCGSSHDSSSRDSSIIRGS